MCCCLRRTQRRADRRAAGRVELDVFRLTFGTLDVLTCGCCWVIHVGRAGQMGLRHSLCPRGPGSEEIVLSPPSSPVLRPTHSQCHQTLNWTKSTHQSSMCPNNAQPWSANLLSRKGELAAQVPVSTHDPHQHASTATIGEGRLRMAQREGCEAVFA